MPAPICYGYSSITGEFTGLVAADRSPREPNVWLIPAFTVSVPPPVVTTGLVAVWTGTSWTLAPKPSGVPDESEPPTDLALYAAYRRQQFEVKGSTWNEWLVHTDRESQGKITAEVLAIQIGAREDGDGWKFADGIFRMLTNAEMSSLAIAVRNHVRDAFGREAYALAAIVAGTATTHADVDAFFEVVVD
ncbi:DUF4376 domain-containing protein [Microvirga brassicacearum]|uniref:DUF4376 domain-containing protein n=1 Tax=Microvirga brassicacearum TaxID=2580413 RepID=A0A5N3PH84_9HYPH|nr:DUF4376 domain-containing protein [Microvirga brassicacearum]KAB0269070.1 DUF4376 domain-containing protein [Microvirga brassicacearum]